MINGPNRDKDCFFVERLKCGFAKFIRVSGNRIEIFVKVERSVSIDQGDAVVDDLSKIRKILSVESTDNSTPAKHNGELIRQSAQKISVGLAGLVGNVNFKPCSYG